MTTMIAPLYTCRAYKRERLRPIHVWAGIEFDIQGENP